MKIGCMYQFILRYKMKQLYNTERGGSVVTHETRIQIPWPTNLNEVFGSFFGRHLGGLFWQVFMGFFLGFLGGFL